MAITPAKPKISPSLNQLGPALLPDENSNHLPCLAVIEPDASGHSGMTAAVLSDGKISQVTGLQDPPTLPSGVPAIALVSCDPVTGALGVFKPKSAKSADAVSAAGKFGSAVQTGTGSAQNVAHGLGVVPSLVLVAIYDTNGVALPHAIAEGTHTTTNVVLTVTSGVKFKVLAFV